MDNDPYFEDPSEMAGTMTIEIGQNGEITINGTTPPKTMLEYLEDWHDGLVDEYKEEQCDS